ncbi:MAG: hypothetical protein SNJ52_00510 [Verrucomicrobiia bacterium]
MTPPSSPPRPRRSAGRSLPEFTLSNRPRAGRQVKKRGARRSPAAGQESGEKAAQGTRREDREQKLPTSVDGKQWWVDPLAGLLGQINLTRSLFLAAHGDFGGFGAGSDFATMAQVRVGLNLTRHTFAKLGCRYFIFITNSSMPARSTMPCSMGYYGIFPHRYHVLSHLPGVIGKGTPNSSGIHEVKCTITTPLASCSILGRT